MYAKWEAKSLVSQQTKAFTEFTYSLLLYRLISCDFTGFDLPDFLIQKWCELYKLDKLFRGKMSRLRKALMCFVFQYSSHVRYHINLLMLSIIMHIIISS